MVDIPKIKIKINDFRAIKSADIILNGITVLAGINGCGKSTISKLLYNSIKTAIEFEKIVKENLFDELRDIRPFLEELSHEVEIFYRENKEFKKKDLKDDFEIGFKFNRLFYFNSAMDLKEQENKILASIDYYIKTLSELPLEFKKEERYRIRLYRLERFFKEEFFEKNKIVFDYVNNNIPTDTAFKAIKIEEQAKKLDEIH